ncbi:MAG: hypothetical protein AB8B83_07420 [Bdellovibrionales bacterium]
MIRNLLILLIFLGAGFGASIAQSDLFVRQPSNAVSQGNENNREKRPIYLRPFETNEAPAARVQRQLRDRLSTSRIADQIAGESKILNYWKKAGRLPETVEEMRSYARALRSANLVRVIQKREDINAKIEAQLKKEFDKFREKIMAQAPDLGAFNKVNDLIEKGLGLAELLKDPESAVKDAIQDAVISNVDEEIKKLEDDARDRVRDAKQAEASVRKPLYVTKPREPVSEQESTPASRVYKNYR